MKHTKFQKLLLAKKPRGRCLHEYTRELPERYRECTCGTLILPPRGDSLETIAKARRGAGRPSKLNDKLLDQICEFVREGATPHTAAQMAGVPRKTFYRWWDHEGTEYELMREAIYLAAAEARGANEMAVHKGVKDRLPWLRSMARDAEHGFAGWEDKVSGEIKHAHAHIHALTPTIDVSKLSISELEVLETVISKALLPEGEGGDND